MNEVWNEVNFLRTDKHQGFLQYGITIFTWSGMPKITNCRILKTEVSHKGLDGLP